MGEGVSPSLFPCREKESRDAGSLTHTEGGDLRPDILHRVIDRQAGGDHTPWRIDIEMNVFVWIFGLQKKHLGDDDIGHVIVDGVPTKMIRSFKRRE